ncbi:MAG: inner membrane CreD family protein, partial [Candidatus Sulfotelmatobacter sp.]
MLRQILALAFIFVCTSIAWVILGATIFNRTYGSHEQLQGRVASTWGTAQEQSPPTATYTTTDVVNTTTVENGKVIVRSKTEHWQVPMPVQASRIKVNLHLTPRQKGLLWYSTYAVEFAGDYRFRNNTTEAQTVDFRLKFPAQKAIYDGLQMKVNQQVISLTTDAQGTVGQATVGPGETASLYVAYRSQGLDSWRYQLG